MADEIPVVVKSASGKVLTKGIYLVATDEVKLPNGQRHKASWLKENKYSFEPIEPPPVKASSPKYVADDFESIRERAKELNLRFIP